MNGLDDFSDEKQYTDLNKKGAIKFHFHDPSKALLFANNKVI